MHSEYKKFHLGTPLQYSCLENPMDGEEPGRLQSMRPLRVGRNWASSLSLSCIGEGNDNPLQCSCQENPRDGEDWWAAVYGVAQSWTRLKWLSSSSSNTFSQTSHNEVGKLADVRGKKKKVTLASFNGKLPSGITVLTYWVSQKVYSGFSIRYYEKSQRNFLANPIVLMVW